MSRNSGDSSKNSVTPYQSFIFIYLTMTGVGFHATIREVSKTTGTDGIWILPLSGLLVWGIVYLLTKLCGRFPRQTLVQFAPTIMDVERKEKMGKGLSLIFVLPLVITWTVVMALQVRIFGEALVSSSYPYTPIEVVILSMLLVSSIAAGSKPGIIARFNEIVFPITLIPIFIMVIGIFEKGTLLNLLPIFQIDWMTVLKSVVLLAFSFGGFEVIYFYSGYYQRPQKALFVHSLAILAVTLLYTSLFTATISVFGVAESKQMIWPMLELVKVMDFPIGILERWESGILVIWMVMVFSSISNLFVALIGLLNNFFELRDGHNQKIIWGSILLIYFLATFPNNVQEVIRYADWMGRIYFIFIVASIIILLFTAWLRKKKGAQPHVTS